MDYIIIVFYLLVAYIIFCKVWPYCFYPNYLMKSRIENYTELIRVASKLKNIDKLQTIENVYKYMQQTYVGHNAVLKIRNLLSVFKLGDFSTKEILDQKQFLWCHTQNRLFKSILVNTGTFKENEILIQKSLWDSFFIHQRLFFKLNGKRIIVDPYYGMFETRSI